MTDVVDATNVLSKLLVLTDLMGTDVSARVVGTIEAGKKHLA
ncbi:hypothetical protein [Ureibacillus xyleni]|nr:hypothetical protein [Ureibacillus xyleni]